MENENNQEIREETEAEVHLRITQRCDELWSWWKENISESEIDREMKAGRQWSPEAIELRRGRVTLTVNKLPQYVERIMGDILQNPTSIKYRATTYNDGGKLTGKVAGQEYTIAEVRSSIAKGIEMRSNAQSWYDHAAQQMCDGGFGWLRTDAVLDDYMRPVLEISGVQNPSDAMIDYTGIKPDFSDARDGFVFTRIPKKVFEQAFPEESAVDFSANQFTGRFPWVREELVIVAEYWERIQRPLSEIKQAMAEGKKIPAYKVVWRRLSGKSILEGGAKGVLTPFSTIPLVPMIGDRIVLADGTVLFQSVHRHARDAQKDSNYWRSAMTETVAAQPHQPWVGTEAMFEGNESAWDSANVARPSKLAFKADPDFPGGRPIKEPPPDIPAAAMQLYMTAVSDLQQSIGMYSASVGAVRGDESGRAILAKERQDSTGKYGFTHGRNQAVRRIGSLLQDAMPHIYASAQEIRIIGPDDSAQDYVDIPGAEALTEPYECYVEAGPSYATQRIETVNVLMELAKSAPEKIIGEGADIIVENLDFPAAQRLADRFKKSIPRQLLSPTEMADIEKENQGVPPPPPDPNLQLQAAIEQAKAAQSEFRVAQEKLKVQQEQLQAQQEEIRLMAEQQRAANEEAVRDQVAKALAEFISQTQPRQGLPGQQ